MDGTSELCRCGRRPRRGGRCRLGEPRNQGSRARSGTARSSSGRAPSSAKGGARPPLAGRSRRRISAAIVAPTLPCICISLDGPRVASNDRIAERRCGAGYPYPTGEARRLPPPRTTNRRHRDVIYPSLLRPSEPRFRSLQNAEKFLATAPPFAIQPLDFQHAMAGEADRMMVPIRVFSLFSGKARSLHPPCTTFAARRNIPLCLRGNDKEGSR